MGVPFPKLPMTLAEEEPAAGPWRVAPLSELVAVLLDAVREPLLRGHSVHYEPPAWASRGRAGQIDVSAKASLLIIEGVGAARRELTHLLDAGVWLQSDCIEAERRGILR